VTTASPPSAPPTGWRTWLAGARPRTLPAAVVPVAVGTSAVSDGPITWWRVVAALVVSLALQVGVNYANDYSDGVRGTDEVRVGPLRLVGSGLASPGAVKRAAFASFGVACIAGLALAAATSWWLLAVGVAAVLAAWGYTGGPNPYGYLGLGELFVFVFFGVVATVGSAFVQQERVSGLAAAASVAVGLLATALLVTNNLRDIPTDRVSGKKTLAVRLGDARSRRLYVAMVGGAFVVALLTAIQEPPVLYVLAALPLAVPPVRRTLGGAKGPALIAVLQETGRLQLVFGALYTLGLATGLA
jgi:1,4-dihydroxy-2-naphthoate polyprenyltransferase